MDWFSDFLGVSVRITGISSHGVILQGRYPTLSAGGLSEV